MRDPIDMLPTKTDLILLLNSPYRSTMLSLSTFEYKFKSTLKLFRLALLLNFTIVEASLVPPVICMPSMFNTSLETFTVDKTCTPLLLLVMSKDLTASIDGICLIRIDGNCGKLMLLASISVFMYITLFPIATCSIPNIRLSGKSLIGLNISCTSMDTSVLIVINAMNCSLIRTPISICCILVSIGSLAIQITLIVELTCFMSK
eukprot:NODE_419_length_8955_cov_0.206527.p2 type:complete len:204 gc:universal NODE_419_length_8955_cov_0.206527:2377-2988(+)